MLLAPLGAEHPALVARCRDVKAPGLRTLLDDLWKDLLHCKPAANVSAAYIGQRLLEVARLLRGPARGELLAGSDELLDAALGELLRELDASPSDGAAHTS